MNIYLDFEFSGLHQNTTPISLGIVSDDGKKLYIEFLDYDKGQIDDWLKVNVLDNLWEHNYPEEYLGDLMNGTLTYYRCNREAAKTFLYKWLNQWDEVKVWSDCLSFDWVLFCQLFGGAFGVPMHVYYIPFDLCTALLMAGVDPDISREKYAGVSNDKNKHHALFDAEIIRKCVHKTIEEKTLI